MTQIRATAGQQADIIFDGPRGGDPGPTTPRGGGGTFDDIVLTGAIKALYDKLGGKRWAVPLSSGNDIGGGGFMVSFAPALRRPYTHVIVSSPTTGAHLMTRVMVDGWVNRADRGSLGFPTTDTLSTHDGAGRYQVFQNAVMVWHSATGVHAVQGPIRARYTQLGGSVFGYPSTEQGAAANGGHFMHFLDPASGATKSIYWSTATGPWEVFGAIREAWAAAKWESGPLGFPAGGELPTHDGVGRYQVFQNGIYVWHPTSGAHEVHGAIQARYGQLGGSAWGYPTTDERPAHHDGRFNHFVLVGTGEVRSIYWTAATGAVEVVGAIRAKWEQLGWERSSLGYPVGPEKLWSQVGSTGTAESGWEQPFQGGRMLCRSSDGNTGPDPVVFRTSINGTGVRGEVVVSIPYDGRAHLGGKVRAISADSYDYLVNALVQTPRNTAVLFHERGEINGTFESGSRQDDFNQLSDHVIPNVLFWDFQNAKLAVDKKYDSHLTGAIGDIVEGIVTWVAGATVLATPGAALVLLGGTAIGTAITGGSVASGMRIVGGTLWLAGPYGTLIALAASAIAELASADRSISDEEYRLVKRVFGETLPPQDKIQITNAIGGGNRPFTYPAPNRTVFINIGKGAYHDALRYHNDPGNPDWHEYGQLLVHEMTHVWQYYNNPADISYVADAIWGSLRQDYEPGAVLDEPWDWFGLEEQGRIVENWYRAFYNGPGSSADRLTPGVGSTADNYGLDSPAARADQAYTFIANNIREGRN